MESLNSELEIKPMAATPYDNEPRRLQKKKYLMLGLYLGFIFLSPTLDLTLNEQNAARLWPLFSIAISIFPLLWCKYDAKQHGKRMDRLTGLVIVIMSFLGIAVYFGKVRRRTFGECASIFFLLSLMFVGVYIAGAFVLTYAYFFLNPGAEIFM